MSMEKKKNIFVGFSFGPQQAEKLLEWSKVGLQTAANQYEWGFINGLEEEIDIISALPIGGYPFGNKKLFYRSCIEETQGGTVKYLSFINLYLIREKIFEEKIYKYLKRRIDETNQEVVVYVYSLYLPFLKALYRLKKLKKNFHYCLIVPDLPGKYGIMRKKRSLRGIKDRVEVKKKFQLAGMADSYVFLTEQMKELFPKKPYSVIEGFLPQCEFDYTQERCPKTILYTGALNEAFGIRTLLEAFMRIDDPEYGLWICGAGEAQKLVEKSAESDTRIKYMGYLPKHDIALLQTRCDVLINPRPNIELFTKYSFPSKTMEYLLSGSKVLMYYLDGIDKGYYDFIYTIDEMGVDSLMQSIRKACDDKEFFNCKSAKQVEWMKANKQAVQQVKGIKEIIAK